MTTLQDFERAIKENPRRSGEDVLEWFRRLTNAAGEPVQSMPELRPFERGRLPYRDPGEEG